MLKIKNIQTIIGQEYNDTLNIIGVIEHKDHYEFTLGYVSLGPVNIETILLHRKQTDNGMYVMEYDNKTGKTLISTKEGGLYGITNNDTISVRPKKYNNSGAAAGEVAKIADSVNALANQVKMMTQQPIYVSAKVNDRELLAFNADRVNERSNLEKRDAYRIQ